MDIAKLETKAAHDTGAEVRIIGPDGRLTDFYITVVGLDSAVWRSIMRKQHRDALNAAMEGAEHDIDAESPALLAEATIGWRGLEADGEAVEFSKETAKRLYENAPYIADQLDRFIGKRANFSNG